MDRAFFDDLIDELYGTSIFVNSVSPVYGGDINESFAIELSDGRTMFIKTNRAGALDMFKAEERGLSAIRSTGTISAPEVVCSGISGDRSYLMMSYISGASGRKDFWESFAHSLADMHKSDTSGFVPSGKFGFEIDNYIGSGEQRNTPEDSWIRFFTEHRLKPQFERAKRFFNYIDLEKTDRLMERIPRLLVEPETPALIHGDLWSGNYVTGDDGYAWLIDPAVYVGHPEADIAMTELFGGYDRRFYEAYRESGLLMPGYEERRDIYNLYHMLNHLNLFGSGYYGAVMRIVDRILAPIS